MADNSIGDHEFLSLRGELAPPRQTIELDERPGTAGTAITWTGMKGRPFQMVSQVDAENYGHARSLYESYLTAIDDEPVDVVQGGLATSVSGYLCQVLEVQAVRLTALAGSAGVRINSPSAGWCECLWTLIAMVSEDLELDLGEAAMFGDYSTTGQMANVNYAVGNATLGNFTSTLPTAVGRSRPLEVMLDVSNGNQWKIVGFGGQTMNGLAEISLATDKQVKKFVPRNGNWLVF